MNPLRNFPPMCPEDLASGPGSADTRDEDDFARLPDPGTEPEPTEEQLARDIELYGVEGERGEPMIALERVASPYDAVKWPADDRSAPDYAHLAGAAAPARFTLTAAVLDRLIAANSFQPYTAKNSIAFALRGAKLATGDQAEGVSAIELEDIRPNHSDFRCVIGYYFISSRTLNAYTASTVPCRKAVYRFLHGGEACNLLPTGLYSYYIWRHKAIRPALRLCTSNLSAEKLEEGALATVLRSEGDPIFDTLGKWDPSRPLDDVHCSYYLGYNEDLGAYFSSWGCMTVRGRKTPSDQWEKFQAVLSGLGSKSQVDLMLITGRDAAIAAQAVAAGTHLSSAEMRLRGGSQGQAVERLQTKLGIAVTGSFGAETRDALVKVQHTINSQHGLGEVADGIYSPQFEQLTGWGIFDPIGA